MLTIYSASAGTGKTHTLTGEYLSLLFQGKDQHRHILAVTFTNKATAEMKSRIIEELFRLADHQSSDFLTLLSENGKKDEMAIRTQAKNILRAILHDYSAFYISTIDHFFQQTLRSFTREIGLQGNYQIELNTELMLEKAVGNMISQLEKTENKSLMNWLLRFTEDKIEETGRWDIQHEIIKLGHQLFKETYKSYSHQIQEEIAQKQFLSNYRDTLYQIIQSTRETAKSFGEQGVELMKKYDLQPSDFIRGKNSPFFMFDKLAAGFIPELKETFCSLEDNLDGYLAKKSSPTLRQAAELIYTNGMNELVRGIVSFYDNLTDYYTAIEINRNFYTLGLLTDLAKHIAQWREDNNKLLIADTTELLNKIIDGSDAPFIYEKTGVRIDHYMIDEFQDTSVMQWSNFRPLLKDSLDNGRNNLVVGDVKQSIYRFRNSDWKLLDQQVKIDFKNQTIEKNLNVNWRSCRYIVELNNRLFRVLPAILQQAYNEEVAQSSLPENVKESFQTRIISAYKNCEQQVATHFKEKEGHVSIHFLSDNDECTWKEQSMQQLPLIVEQLQDKGYALRDMAILTRTNPEGLLAAETLLKYKETHPESPYKYDIITEDSLTVGSSLSVRWMIDMFRYLAHPENNSCKEMAQIAFALMKSKKNPVDDTAYPADFTCTENMGSNPSTLVNDPNMAASINHFLQPFNAEIEAKLKQLSNLSLYELAEGLYRLFEADFPDNELVYMQAFFDLIAEFTTAETADMGQFLAWWEEKGNKQKISTPDAQNAIRIMTIHKSKGLGFKVVLIPFADWKLDQKDAFLWCHPTQKPFNAMSLAPLKYSKILKETIFASDYFTEKLHAYIDNLNTLYVAFTRAKEMLIVTAPKPKPKAEAISIASLLWNGLVADEQLLFDTQSGSYEQGCHPLHDDMKSKIMTSCRHGEGLETPAIEEWPIERLHSLSPDQRMLLRLHHNSGLFDNEKRKYGLLMHDILSHIIHRDDITSALSEKYASGDINSEETAILKEQLLSLTTENEVNSWFDGSMQVMNETEILFGKGKSLRPDRLMIDSNNHVVLVDYKFGEHKEKTYQRQMEKYTSLIREMGYQNITGYIWYVTRHEIEKN